MSPSQKMFIQYANRKIIGGHLLRVLNLVIKSQYWNIILLTGFINNLKNIQ